LRRSTVDKIDFRNRVPIESRYCTIIENRMLCFRFLFIDNDVPVHQNISDVRNPLEMLTLMFLFFLHKFPMPVRTYILVISPPQQRGGGFCDLPEYIVYPPNVPVLHNIFDARVFSANFDEHSLHDNSG